MTAIMLHYNATQVLFGTMFNPAIYKYSKMKIKFVLINKMECKHDIKILGIETGGVKLKYFLGLSFI